MINHKNFANSNLAMLALIAKKLGQLKDDFVFLGGCTTALFITDPATPDVRTTLDVDCIVDVMSTRCYHKLAKRLTKQGFKQSIEDEMICRWRYNDLILDVMPVEKEILGFGNPWYKSAIEHTIIYQIADDLEIKLVTAPYFLATKIEAFKTRGKQDFLASHDFEDILTVIDGRAELLEEVSAAEYDVRKHLTNFFSNILKSDAFYFALPGHLKYGSLTDDRMKIVLERIHKIACTD